MYGSRNAVGESAGTPASVKRRTVANPSSLSVRRVTQVREADGPGRVDGQRRVRRVMHDQTLA
jgi:hypothetical protein